MSTLRNKRLTANLTSPVIKDSNIEHIGTRIQISEYTDMDNQELLVDKTYRSPEDILHINIELEIDVEKNLYVRHAYIYRDKTTQEEYGSDTFGFITSIYGNQSGVKLGNNIISTPVVTKSINNASYNTGFIKVDISNYNVLVGSGDHVSTDWLITTDTNEVLFERLKDKDNLKSILIPADIFKDYKMFIIQARFNSSTNGFSNYGRYYYVTSSLYNKYISLKPILPFYKGKTLYYSAAYNILNITSVGLVLKEVLGDVEVEVYRKENYTPSQSMGIPSDNLKVGAVYRLYSFVNMNIDGKVSRSETLLSDEFILLEEKKYASSLLADYPGKYTKCPELVIGAAVNVSRELPNNTFLLAKNTNSKLSIYSRYNNTVRDTGLTVDLPSGITNTYVPYINVIPLYNDIILVNITAYDGTTGYRKSNWICYKADLATNTYTILSNSVFEDEVYSTGMNSSAYVTKDNKVYYIPARYEKVSGTPDLLPLMEITIGSNNSINRRVVRENLIDNVYRNLTIAPLGDGYEETGEFLILGGTDKTGTDIKDNSGNSTGTKQYVLNNLNIYKYNPGTDDLSVFATLPQSFDLNKYSLSAFLRKDGKIVIFNNTDSGLSYTQSASMIIDTKNNNAFSIEDNESNLDIPFRSTLVGSNGDFFRIGYQDESLMYTLLYPHTKLSSYDDDSAVINKNLVVNKGRTITIENPYLYDTITIEGTSLEDTGILKWVDEKAIRYLDFRDTIITRDTVVTEEEANRIPKEHLWVLDGVTYTIKDK